MAFLCFLHHRKKPPNFSQLTETIISRSWNTLQVGILLASLFLLYLLAACSGRFFYEEQIPLARLVITIIIYVIMVSIISIINRRHGGNWVDSLGMGFGNLRRLILAPVFYLAFIPFLMAATSGYHLLLEALFESEVELQDIAKVVSGERSWLGIGYILMAIIVAPVFEELIFRGIVFPYIVKRAGLISGIAVVSVLFSVMHFHLPSMVPLAMLSTALCLAYWRTGSLWVSIGIHVIFNAVTILALNVMG